MAFAPRKAFPCAAAKEPNPSGAPRQCLANGADTSLFVILSVVEKSRSRKAADKEKMRFLRFTPFVRFGRNDSVGDSSREMKERRVAAFYSESYKHHDFQLIHSIQK